LTEKIGVIKLALTVERQFNYRISEVS